jgi:GT2 family glycosyltransferase
MADHEESSPRQKRPASAGRGGGVLLIIPSLGGPRLERCLDAVAALEPSPDLTMVVLSGGAEAPPRRDGVEALQFARRLGFTGAVNAALAEAGEADRIALVNDDADPVPNWLGELCARLDSEPRLAAVQGTVVDPAQSQVDGRGISLDRFGLPIQIDRGLQFVDEVGSLREILAVSATASVLRGSAVREASIFGNAIFDPRFGSYHEDLDLGLRLRRLGWSAAWVGGIPTRHLGSATGQRLRWRHPWWLLANRWRALAGNLTRLALLRALPALIRGELRAVNTLIRSNPRTAFVAPAATLSLPWIITSSWRRVTPGPRLSALPGAS